MTGIHVRAIVSLLVVLFSRQVAAVTYANAATTYAWINPASQTNVTWSYDTQCTASPGAPVDDDITAPINIGFTFTFGGTAYTQVRIMSNGRVQFGNNYCYYGSQSIGPPRTYPPQTTLPTANLTNTMKVYGADFDPIVNDPGSGTTCPTSTCYVRYTSTPIGTAPNRQFVVTFANVPEYGAHGSYFNLQVILNEDGTFVYQYGPSNNTSGGAAQIGWELTTADYDVPYTGPRPNGTAIRFYIPAALASYRLDEATWSGVGSIIDFSGNGNNAGPLGAVAPTPAGKVCGGADIPRNTSRATMDAVATPLNVSTNIGGSGTVTFWYYNNRAWNAGGGRSRNRTLLDATSPGVGHSDPRDFWLVLLRTGGLQFEVADSGGGSHSTTTSNETFSADTWTHIGITWNLAAGRMSIYVNGALASQLNGGAIAMADYATLYLGDNRQNVDLNPNVGSSADGRLDEVNIYNFEGGAPLIARDMNATHACTQIDHFNIAVSGAASTCAASNVTVSAIDAANAVLPSYAGTVNISTSVNHGNWAKVTATGTLTQGTPDSGAATYGFTGAGAGADNGVVTLSLANAHADDLTITVVDPSIPSTSRTSAVLGFRDNAFVITPDPITVAGKPQSMSVAMWQKDPTTGNCQVASGYTGSKGLDAWLSRDPSDPGGIAPTINAVSLPNSPTGGQGIDNLSLSFNAGTAGFSMLTTDVGKYTLNLRDDSRSFAKAVDITGSTAVLTVRPWLCLTVPGNPGGSNPTDAVFTTAGSDFSATVKGVLWNAAQDPGNTGSPIVGANVCGNSVAPAFAWNTSLSANTPFTPSSGVLGTLNNNNVPQAAFAGGTASPGNLQYTEVGSFTMNAAVSNYLNTSGVNLSASAGPVGRFKPYQFGISHNTPVFSAGCNGGGFTYAGQPFSYQTVPVITVTALNALGAVTQNYTGTFWKITNASLTAKTYSALSGTLDLGLLPAIDPVIQDKGGGTGTLTFGSGGGIAFTRGAPLAPFNAEIALSINVIDSDNVVPLAPKPNPVVFGQAAAGNGIAFDDGSAATANDKQIFWGRLRMVNGFGSELLPVIANVYAEYATGAGAFVTNTADQCTLIQLSALKLSNNLASPPIGTPTINVTGSATTTASVVNSPLLLGKSAFSFSAPGQGNTGYVNLLYDLGTASRPWLQYDWAGTGSNNQNPTARVDFGIYPGSSRYIYLREPW